MPYMGKSVDNKSSEIRRFDVTSSTSATHTLSWTAPSEQSLIVTINGVKQHEDAYSVSGTTLTLTSALVATDKLEVIGINDIGSTITPGPGSVNESQLGSDSVSTIKLQDNAITNAKMADDAVGLAELSATGTPSASTFLRGDNAWASAAAGLTSVQTFTSSGTWTKPSGITKINITVIGGGGGGGAGHQTTAYGAYGGQAGGTALKFAYDVSSKSSATITIGAGGAGGTYSASNDNPGSIGGNSSYADGTLTMTGTGGGFGHSSHSSANAFTPASVSSGGDLNLTGQYPNIVPYNYYIGGGGADAYLFNGGANEVYNGTGGAARSYGGGGGGAGNKNDNGGAGFAGIVIIEEYK